jgi:hypothetical protein
VLESVLRTCNISIPLGHLLSYFFVPISSKSFHFKVRQQMKQSKCGRRGIKYKRGLQFEKAIYSKYYIPKALFSHFPTFLLISDFRHILHLPFGCWNGLFSCLEIVLHPNIQGEEERKSAEDISPITIREEKFSLLSLWPKWRPWLQTWKKHDALNGNEDEGGKERERVSLVVWNAWLSRERSKFNMSKFF